MDNSKLVFLINCIWEELEVRNHLDFDKLKIKLKNFILDDSDYEIIIKKISDAPKEFKKNKNYLEIFLKEDEEIQKILSNIKSNIYNQTNIEDNTFNNSPYTGINYGEQHFNYSGKQFDLNKKIMLTNLSMLSDNFTGREKYIKEIDSLFTNQDVIVLSSNGGIGKTQIVLQYLKKFKGKYEHIAFINASSSESILQDYAELLEVENDEYLLKRMKEWSNMNSNWLFIYDNLDDESLKQEFYGKYMVETNGKVIITSRLSLNSWKKTGICIEEFAVNESIELLEKITKLDDYEGAKKLSRVLNNYPLALDQSGAYIKNTEKTYYEYIKLFESKKYKLRILDEEKPNIYHHTIAKTWQISFDKVTNEASKELLNILSYLDSSDIPKKLFFEGIDKLPECLENTLKDELDSDDVFIQLTKYSLININNKKMYIHSLVQDVVRYSLSESEQINWFNIVEGLLSNTFYYDYYKQETWQWTNSLITHIMMFIKLSYEYEVENENIAYLCHTLGQLYSAQGKYEEAEEYYKKALVISEKVLGFEHPSTATTYSNLGQLYSAQGKYEEAESLFKKSLKIFENILGESHPYTNIVRENLKIFLQNKMV